MNQMSYAVASDSIRRSVEAKLSFMTLGSEVASDRLVLAVRAMAIKLSTFPVQPQIFSTFTSALHTSGFVSYLVNRCIRA